MKTKQLSYYLELVKSAGHKNEWLKAKRYGEEALRKLNRLAYSPLEEYLLYYRMGYICDIFADYSRSFDFFYKAHVTASKNNLKESYIAHAVDMIGSSFLRIKSIDRALEQFNKVDEYYHKYGHDTEPMNKERFISHLIDFAYCYLYKNDLEKAGEVIEKKLTVYMPFRSNSLSASYYHLNGEYCIEKGDYRKARESINEFISLRQEAGSIRDILEGKIHLAVIDLLEGKLDLTIKDLSVILKESGKEKQNDFICIAGLLLSKCYNLKSLPDKASTVEKQIKPVLNKLDITWMYEQIRDLEALYRKLEPIYHKKQANTIPVVLSKTLDKYNESTGYKSRIIGESYLMREIFQLIEKIAPTDLPVLIQGETGVGKELIARSIHINSLRSGKPWLALNCAAVSEALLENELFGHVKGAFTDAKEEKKGYVESASAGTLFLDEISEMPLAMQQKLLRVLEEKLVWRVGAEKAVPVDTRFIFAGNKNIEELVRAKKFREDLYYRINTIVITMPPLRDRKEDIPLLIQYFLKKYATKRITNDPRYQSGLRDATQIPITNGALNLFTNYNWPGNVRELENEIKRIYTLYPKSESITESMLSANIRNYKTSDDSTVKSLKETRKLAERDTIIEALKKCKGNVAEAARKFGYNRSSFYRKIKQLKIPITDIADKSGDL